MWRGRSDRSEDDDTESGNTDGKRRDRRGRLGEDPRTDIRGGGIRRIGDTGTEGPGGEYPPNGSEGLDDSPPSYAPTDPGWNTDDFSSLDLGSDLNDKGVRPVRRLNLPPLSQPAVDDDGPEADSTSSPADDTATSNGSPNDASSSNGSSGDMSTLDSLAAATEAAAAAEPSDLLDAKVTGSGPTYVNNGERESVNEPYEDGIKNELGVFAADDNDATSVFSDQADNDPERRLQPAVSASYEQRPGANPASMPLSGTPPTPPSSSSAPKQGAPPHPLAATAGAGLTRGDRGQLHSPSTGLDDGGYRPGSSGDGFGSSSEGRATGGSWPEDIGSPRYDDPRPRNPVDLAPVVPSEEKDRRWMLPVVGLLAVLAFAAGYYLFLRGDADDSDNFAVDDSATGDLVEEDLEPEGATTEDTSAMTDAPTVLSESPLLSLPGASDGPLATETQYELQLEGVPEGSLYLVIVDDIPQEPALDYVPLLILPEGRHTISVQIESGPNTATTNAVDVYVLAPELSATYRANLSSVSIGAEGWGEALRQFDEFRAAGHEALVLSPSDPYPSLLPGFWNLYVGGFDDHAGAQEYCEQAGLDIPDACFPAPFDPNGPPRDG